MRDRRLKCVQAIIQGQQAMTTKFNSDDFIFPEQDARMRLLRACGQVINRLAMFPFGHRLWVDAVTLGKCPHALLTMFVGSPP